ncbi:hypothetical protein J8I29_17825 [Labrys sp. LIt4]|uniref:hypothetical protein n=1 Tax=Labrys sp. LIt4 TaxID=2821355 RepID=UPI001ADF8005|nr:hypothetical protein [Labrys sp. LIt4]MBP0581191.1 hypothetical protein [Labrys sp. LIt4]
MLARLTLPILTCLWLVAAAQAQSTRVSACAPEADPLGCEQARENLSPEMLRLLSAYPHGGQTLEETAYRTAVTQPEQAFALVALANRSNPEQMAAIARGLLRAFDELADSSPQCRAGCMDRLQKIMMLRGLHSTTPHAVRKDCTPEKVGLKPYSPSCGMPVRAAMQCADLALTSLLTALARQQFATLATPSGRPRGCFAPVYQSPHNAAGWTLSAPSNLPISRN